MVYNEFIRCEVCGCITRIRLQVGWLDEHPIAVTCGKCGISLKGKVKIGQDTLGLKFEFVGRFPELFLFYRLFSPLYSEMICIFPYFCPCEIIVREIREISF